MTALEEMHQDSEVQVQGDQAIFFQPSAQFQKWAGIWLGPSTTF